MYLFGSRANGTARPNSDVDLAVVPRDEQVREQKLAILTELTREGFDDVSLVFVEGRDLVLDYQAVRSNVLVYQAPDFDRGETYSLVVRRYLDFKPFLDVQRAAYKRRLLGGRP